MQCSVSIKYKKERQYLSNLASSKFNKIQQEQNKTSYRATNYSNQLKRPRNSCIQSCTELKNSISFYSRLRFSTNKNLNNLFQHI